MTPRGQDDWERFQAWAVHPLMGWIVACTMLAVLADVVVAAAWRIFG